MKDEDRLRERLRQLPREVAPERDLWPEVARRAKARRRRWPLLAAASLAAAAAVVPMLRPAPQAPPPIARAPLPSAPPSEPPERAELPEEAEYVRALASLEFELEQRRPEMPERARQAVDEELRTVDAAIAASRAARIARPDDGELASDLARAYEDKIDLLRETTELVTGI
jgi:hypothetical protein